MNATTQTAIDAWYIEHLSCPRDGSTLRQSGPQLTCSNGHSYPIVEGLPVMLLDDVEQTIGVARASLDVARRVVAGETGHTFYLETLGLFDEQRRGIVALSATDTPVDPVVAYMLGATSGNMYNELIGKVKEYPIPDLPLPPGQGRMLLDIGCNWGRWSMAAARAGYSVIGIDPSLGAVLAARRVCAQLGLACRFIVADARYLPLKTDSVDVGFSYGVLQHMSKDNVRAALRQLERVVVPGGVVKIQMAHILGVRSIYQQFKLRFRRPTRFNVRYWTLPTLRALAVEAFGRTEVAVDCFFGLGLQAADERLLTPSKRLILRTSNRLRDLSRSAPVLANVADSIYLSARNEKPRRTQSDVAVPAPPPA